MKRITAFLISLLMLISPAIAMETDQYNLPTKPLVDIGDEVTLFAENRLYQVIEKLNKKIDAQMACLEVRTDHCGSEAKVKKELAKLRSEDVLAKALYGRLGDGIMPFTKVGFWVENHEFETQPARYKASLKKSIHITAPLNLLTISPTIRMYGEEFGTDKIEHIFQQGYDYYWRYRKAKRKGLSEEASVKKAIKFGQKTERTYFGYWVSAIYSNADLAANYAGLRFYQGLTHDVKIGGYTRPALAGIVDGKWRMRENVDVRNELIKPFVSRHLNEAYNPNKIFNIAGYRSMVKRKVRKYACAQWFERDPNLSKASLEATTTSLENWYGEEYGYSRSKHFVTIANTCFGDKNNSQAAE